MITSLPTTNLLMQLLPRTIAALATAATLLFLATIVLPAAYGDSTHISADTNVDVDQKNNCKSTAKDISVSANECNNDAIFSVT